jgi:hypothetical protein
MKQGTILGPSSVALCCVCGELAQVRSRYEDMCQFHWDCLKHELKIRLDAIRDFGPYNKDNGPTYGLTVYGYCHGDRDKGPKYAEAGYTTLGLGLYVSRTPQEAMTEALRMSRRNGWTLLRLDTQNTAPRRYGQSCTDIFVSPLFATYMKYSDLRPLDYDAARFGALDPALASLV